MMTILYKYIFKRFLSSFSFLSAGLMLLVFLIDSIETAYGLSRREDTQLFDAIGLSLLKMPGLFEQILPFALLLTSVMLFRRLSLDSEMDIVRSIGISAWQFLLPIATISFLISLLSITLLNPIAIQLNALYEHREDIARGEADPNPTIIQENSWVRDKVGDDYYMVRMGRVIPMSKNKDQLKVINGNIRIQDEKGNLIKQILFNDATISDLSWSLNKATYIDYINQTTEYKDSSLLPMSSPATEFVRRSISPEYLTIWQLPQNIQILKRSGLTTTSHILYFLNKLVQPFLFVSLSVFGAVLALQPSRRGGNSYIILASIISGFIIWTFSSIVFSLGLEGNMPVTIAALLPTIIVLMIVISLILYKEDG